MTSSIDLFQRLFICPEGYKLMTEISRGMSADSLQFVRDVITFYEAHKQTMHFLSFLITDEMQKATNGSMFRGNSFCSRCLTMYTFITMSNQYVVNFLKEPMDEIFSGKYGSLEVVPDIGTAKILERIEKLKTCVSKFIASIIETSELWPESYRYICYVLYNETKKLNIIKPIQSIGGFLILRLICPAIVQPHKTGFCLEKPSDEVMRNLVVVCKIVQCISNATAPHEPLLKGLESYISQESLKLEAELERVFSVRPSKFSFVPIKDKDLETAINGILSLWAENQKTVTTYLQENARQEFKELAEAVMLFNSKEYVSKKSVMKKKAKEDEAIQQLFAIARNGNVVDCESVLKKYPELIDCTDVDMMTPLHYAFVFKNTEVVLYLLKNGASLYLKDAMGMNALHYACQSNMVETFDFFQSCDYSEVGEVNEEGNTCLHYLSQHQFGEKHEAFVQYLLCKDSALLNVANYAGDTPLHFAVNCYLSDTEIGTYTVKTLVKFGANCTLENLKKITPLMLAQQKGKIDIISLLVVDEVCKPISPQPNLKLNAEIIRIRTNSAEVAAKKRGKSGSHKLPSSPRLLPAYLTKQTTQPIKSSPVVNK
ncbi:ankyrin repeat-containing protein, putative [Entamoeba invadens IP1]|uniref:Ankyrin repeat-containing protein, putative n=1 Tax=Entamoeba invadens IP1 TaxID=370355 RepID=A0A0A1U5A3_ENTIV|nr:ankyrin repeat-containing protein, putative [Entamoeba invadens IP1]ELP86941.1 ankyrin repeat-containing protein, putative [Entamoeba invadens IP1]|eukprot:XP_004253712.1 ankyrin repeat-containing protein, putative [Entamoeba invadens IP1]